MVIENQIPKTETVYEIKDEYKVPSYEEFVKSYENDGNLRYDDLSGGSVGEVKGYGPCDTCRLSTQWTYLYISCPAAGCPGNNRYTRSNWVHRYCGGYAKISNKARIECSKCERNRHMSVWNFKCSEHSGDTDESVTRKSFNKSLGLAMQNEDCDQVIADLAVYITNHKSEWPN